MTAQAFQCRGPGSVAIDVVNVHAPCDDDKLTDNQRRTLVGALLQERSMCVPGLAIGQARFVIGGDMNTVKPLLCQILRTYDKSDALPFLPYVHEPANASHGNICVHLGFAATTLSTTAVTHNRQHNPYGICWSADTTSATQQPVTVE